MSLQNVSSGGLSNRLTPDRDRRRCAIFNLPAYEAFKLVTGSKLAKPLCVESGLDLPTWLKFVDTRLEKDDAGRVHKDDTHRAVNKFFGETVVDKALLDNLKASGVQYARELRFAGKRNFFTGVKFKPEEQVAISSGLSVVFSNMVVMASDDQSQISDVTDSMSL